MIQEATALEAVPTDGNGAPVSIEANVVAGQPTAAAAADNGHGEPAPQDHTDTADTTLRTSTPEKKRTFDKSTIVKGEVLNANEPQEVDFSDLEPDYSAFLNSYLNNIIKLDRLPNPNDPSHTLFDLVMNDTKHGYNNLLLKRICNEERDQSGKVIRRTVDKDKLKTFFDKQSGFIIVKQIIDYQTELKMSALGMAASVLPEPERQAMALEIQRDPGFLKGLWQVDPPHRRILDMWTRVNADKGNGMRMNANTWQAVYGRREYIKALTGIDMDAMQLVAADPNGNRRLHLREGTTVVGTRIMQQLQDEIIKGYELRKRFYDKINAPSEFPGQRFSTDLANRASHLPLQTDTYIDEEVEYGFQALGGMTDNLAESQLNHLDAQVAVITKTTEDQIREEIYEGQKSRAREVIQAKIDSRGENGSEKEKRMKEATEKNHKLEAQKEKLEGRRVTVTEITAKQNAIKETEDVLRKTYNLPIPAGSDFNTVINGEITKITTIIEIDDGSGKSLETKIAEKTNEYEELTETLANKDIADKTAALKKGQLSEAALADITASAKRRAEVVHGPALQRLNQQKQTLEARKTQLDALRKTRETAINELEEAEKTVIQDAPKELVAINEAYEDYANTPAGVVTLVTSTQIEELSVEELVPLFADPAGSYKKDNATPEQKAELRKYILRVKTEQKAKQTEDKYEKSPPAQKASFENIVTTAGATITPDNLLTMPEQQLSTLLGDPPYNWTAADISTRLPQAQAEASKKLRIRHTIMTEEELKDIKVQQETIKKDSENMDKVIKTEREELEATASVMDRKETEIFPKGAEISLDPTSYTNKSTVPNTDTTYTKAERDAGYAKGYYKFVDLLFDYQQSPKRDRNEYFTIIQRVLPPNELARLLNESFTSPISGTPPDLDEVFLHLQTLLEYRTYNNGNINTAFATIINSLRDKALAYP